MSQTIEQVMQQALDALEGVLDDAAHIQNASISGGLYEVSQCRDAIAALRTQLKAVGAGGVGPMMPAAQPAQTDALKQAAMLCEWIAESPHVRGSINGLAAQVRHALQAQPAEPAEIERLKSDLRDYMMAANAESQLADEWKAKYDELLATTQPQQSAVMPKTWHDRIVAAHPKSEPAHWPVELITNYMTQEITEYRAAWPKGFTVDAARYRWLRSIGHKQLQVIAHYAGIELDNAIDAAIKGDATP